MAAESNLSAVLYAKDDLRLEHRDIKLPGENEVQIAMCSVGICGSDVKYWTHGKCGRFVLEEPMVMGHESSGTVVAVGAGVTHLAKGDRVAIEPGVPCRTCRVCKEGRYNLCADMEFCATPPVHGSLCKLYNHAADFCYKLPDHVSFEEGAMLEPLSVAVYTCQRGEVKVGSKVLIFGAGPIGLLCLLVAKTRGASSVAITDIDDYRLAVAKEYGADHVIKVSTNDSQALAQTIAAEMRGQPDVSLECSGVDSSFVTAIHATRSGGVVVLVGRGSLNVDVPIVNAAVREVDIRGVFRYCNNYPQALAMVASGQVDAKRLITHNFSLEESLKAFQTANSRESRAIKVMINCST
ncbi:sorbitol dehydrogenase-like [Branchiostoma floridae]|uniref:Sorbitol dehydrogenase n=1 Tax=Branchiostoma floridae TaxID=7739 RepID=A0A9J7N1I9_BRAFL|nr:sorbitol dehydrogenase-like [Branchiostoma floridae]